ncbi:MAG: hypothetical protein P8X81_14380, partial [Woeseiaceae bacterium]
FAPPYAGLATLVVNTALGPHWQEAGDLARKALELDPDLAEAHAILGLITTLYDHDPAAGADLLERAIDLDPSYSMSYPWLAISLNRRGRDSEARDVLYRGAEYDPLNPVLISNLADEEELLGNFVAAEQLLLRLFFLPELSGPAMDILDLYHDWGRYDNELNAWKDAFLRLGADSLGDLPYLARNYAALGMRPETDYWFGKHVANSGGNPFLMADFYFVFKHFDDSSVLRDALSGAEEQANDADTELRAAALGYGGLAQLQIGEIETGIEWLEESIELYRFMYQPDGERGSIDVALFDNYWWTRLVVHMFQRLAFAYQQVDRAADAEDILNQLDELLAKVPRAVPMHFEWYALQDGLRGEPDAAFASLSAAVELGWANYHEVVNDPAWAAIIEDSRIADLLDDARQRVEEQRRKVEEIERSEDFKSEFERLIAQ